MTQTNSRKLRTLALLLLAALMLSCLPAGALAESFSAAVKAKSMKVYADPYGRNYLGALPKKTIVTVEAYASGVAKISYKGATGYAKVKDMRAVESFAKEAVTLNSCRVYRELSASSASVRVDSGLELYVLAVKGGIAMVERGGNVGYMKASDLYIEGMGNVALPEDGKGDAAQSKPTQSQLEALKDALEEQAKQEAAQQQQQQQSKPESSTGTMTLEQAFASGKYSNEQLIYAFAIKELGYNTAAAAGLLANISAESGFRTNANGDSGQSYGICQWYAARKTRLLNWCEDKGYDPASLKGQLYFLKHELETYYPAVHRYMKGVENGEQGAYDAGYYFCYNFEAPANRGSKSVSRGNTARNTYYPRYSGYNL